MLDKGSSAATEHGLELFQNDRVWTYLCGNNGPASREFQRMKDSQPTRRRFVAGAGVAVAVGIAGCTGSSNQESNGAGDQHGNQTGSGGDDHSDAEGASLDGPNASATVTMATTDESSHFEPHVVWVETGGTVTWELDSGSHTTTAYAEKTDKPQRIPDGANAWDSGTISEQGETFEHTFETPGVYDYFCVPHEATGMLGTVVIGNPDPDGQPGLQPPQDSLADEAATKIESLNERVTEALGGGSGGSGTNSTDSGGETDSHD